ncbi:TRAPP II complex [Globomyces pollinis-pini]|nr:TRAPP II complex [Globomyces pollinis-pini]
MTPSPLLQGARIKILVVPIYPQRKESFLKYYNLIASCNCVSLEEQTPDSKTAKFLAQIQHKGLIHYDFVTDYNREHQSWEELELSKQIFGIIGIINCKQIPNLQEGYAQFQKISQRYPTAIAQRCFAFEPKDDQRDDIKGIIMIPNVGDTHFYLKTMISDFTQDIFLTFGSLAGTIERKTMIQGPIIISPNFSQQDINDMNNSISTPTLSGTPVTRTDSQGATLDTPQSATSNAPGFMTSLLNVDKTKRRTPSRLQKLLGDLYLLAGRLDLAIESYTAALEGTRANSDHQWSASALEGILTTQLMSYTFKALNSTGNEDDNPQPLPSSEDIIKLSKKSEELYTLICEMPDRYREIVHLYDKSYAFGIVGFYPIFQIAASVKICQFLSLLHLADFEGTFVNGAGVAWSNEVKGYGAELASRMANSNSAALQGVAVQAAGTTATLIPQPLMMQPDKAILQNGVGVTRVDIMTWMTRAWLSGSNYLTYPDQIWTLSSLATICGQLKLHRKHAFYLRLAGITAYQFHLKYPNSKKSKEFIIDSGAVVCMRAALRMLEFGGEMSVADDNYDLWVHEFSSDLEPVIINKGSQFSLAAPSFKPIVKLSYGNPQLQVAVLKEALVIAQYEQDHVNSIYFAGQMLRKFYWYLTRKDQQLFSELFQRVAMYHRKQNLSSRPLNHSSIFSIIKGAPNISLGIPFLRKMELVSPIARNQVTLHQPKQSKTKDKDTFLYSPFAKKQSNEKKEILCATNEMVHVDVTIANPFLFDLDIQSLSITYFIYSYISGTNVSFRAISIATNIPAETRSHIVRLSFIPLEPGIFQMLGVELRMLGGCIEQTIYPLQQYLGSKNFDKNGKYAKQTDMVRFGKKPLNFMDDKPRPPPAPIPQWFIPVTVILPQPSLELMETSLGSHQALTLFEGEKTAIIVTIRNIGVIPINYLFLQFQDTMSIDGVYSSPYESDVYEKNISAFYPISEIEEGFSHELQNNVGLISKMTKIGQLEPFRKDVNIPPGGSLKILIGVYGKNNCTGGTLQLSYGNVTETSNGDFYTRDLSIQFLLTVVNSLSFRNPDTLYHTLANDTAESINLTLADRSISVEEMLMDTRLTTNIPEIEDHSNIFMFTFDIRNQWDEPFKLKFDIYDDDESNTPTSSSSTLIHAGVTQRIILPIKRIFILKHDVQKPIPTAAGKQFVVTKVDQSLPEGLQRALFWYREALIGGLQTRGRLVVSWLCSKGRKGFLPLRSLKLNPRMLAVLKSGNIDIKAEFSDSNLITELGPNRYQSMAYHPVKLKWTITNNQDVSVRLIFRVCPAKDTSVGPIPQTSVHQVVPIGSLSRILTKLEPGTSTTVEMSFLFTAFGDVKLLAHVEHIHPKKVIQKKSKYEAPDVILDEVDRIHWYKPGVSISVVA